MKSSAIPLILLGAATILGFYLGRLAHRVRLPSLIGYMLLGVFLGPSVLELFDVEVTEHLAFITEVSLGFVAFSIGAELNIASLRSLGPGIISIILAESFLAFFAVTGAIYALTADLPMAMVFGAMAPASAPAGTVAVIQEYRSRGSLTKALYAVVGFDDGLAIIIFGFALALAKSLLLQEAQGVSVGLLAGLKEAVAEIALSLATGAGAGVLVRGLLRRIEGKRELLIIVFGCVLALTGLAVRLHLSLILCNMMAGLVLANTWNESRVKRVMEPLLDVMPLLFVWFFCLAGAHLDVASLPALGVVGVVYILARAGGLIGGAFIGSLLGRVEAKVRKYIGLGILSQAGVAIGLSLIVQSEFATMKAGHARTIGTLVITTITATCIVFEVIGPICTKIALTRAGEIPPANP